MCLIWRSVHSQVDTVALPKRQMRHAQFVDLFPCTGPERPRVKTTRRKECRFSALDDDHRNRKHLLAVVVADGADRFQSVRSASRFYAAYRSDLHGVREGAGKPLMSCGRFRIRQVGRTKFTEILTKGCESPFVK